MIEQIEYARRESVARQSALRIDAKSEIVTSGQDMRSGIAKIITNTGDGDYTITEQWSNGTAFVNATAGAGLSAVVATDFRQRDHGIAGQSVRFWQTRTTSDEICTLVDVGPPTKWLARICNGAQFGFDEKVAGAMAFPWSDPEPCGFYIEEIDPVTLCGFKGSRTRTIAGAYIETVGTNLATTQMFHSSDSTGYDDPVIVSDAISHWMPVPHAAIVEVQTITDGSDDTYHVFNLPAPHWTAEITDVSNCGLYDCKWYGIFPTSTGGGNPVIEFSVSSLTGVGPYDSSVGGLDDSRHRYPIPHIGDIIYITADMAATGTTCYRELTQRIPIDAVGATAASGQEQVWMETTSSPQGRGLLRDNY